MTPPLNEEVEDNNSRSIEAKARKTLVNEGCPPCYPTCLAIPLRDPPEKYQAIILYWKSFPGTGDVILQAQLSDWKRFREFQNAVRRYYRHRNFGEFVDQVRECRRRHGLAGNVCVRFDLEQSRLETWFEFQDWHLQHLEGFEKNRDELRKALDNAREEAKSTSAAEDAEACQQDLEYAEWELERHKTLLHWTEQERLAMGTGYPTSLEDREDRDAAPKAISPPTRRKKQLEAPTVLGQVRVSKAKRRKQNTPRQKRKTPESGSAIEVSDTPESSIPQAPKRRESKSRRTKTKTPLRPLCPQRVSKTKRFTEANAKSPKRARQRRSLDQARSSSRQSPQRPQPPYVDIKTRLGRVSRRPERWGFFTCSSAQAAVCC